LAAAIELAFVGLQPVLNPGGRGDFIVTYGNQVVWDKKVQNDQFPDETDILRRLEALGLPRS
jgi:predicted Rdx family selenoprotein